MVIIAKYTDKHLCKYVRLAQFALAFKSTILNADV